MKKVNIKQVMLGTAALAGLMVTSQAVANADSMTIQAGDTVWAYSQKYHVSINEIVKQNKLGSADLIIAGQKINIPGVKTSDNSKTTTASASSVKSTSAATSTSSQATSAAATSSSVTSASSTSQAASSSSVASTSAAVQSSTSTASASSSVASSAAATSQSSSVVNSASQSSVASQSSTSQSSVASQSNTNTSATSQSSTSVASQSSARTTSRAASTTTTTSNASYSSAIAAAYTLVGTPYEQLDCSAFTQAAFAKAGRQIGRTTYAQATLGAHVSFSQAQAGDLVFWGSNGAPYHVAIYLGGGQYIGAHDYGDPASVKSTAYFTPSFAIHM